MTTKVLVIEDEACLRQCLLMMLMAEGYEVMDAEDGSIGVDLAKLSVPDVVICDLRMPRLNGDQVLDLLQRDPNTQAIPFIFISADEQSLAPEPIKTLDRHHFLQKPFSRTDLLAAIAYNQKVKPLTLPSRQFHHTNPTKIQPQHSPCEERLSQRIS